MSYAFTSSKQNRISLFSGLILLSVFFLTNCVKEPSLWKPHANEQVAGDYIDYYPEYSEFSKLVELANLGPLLRIRGPYTVFIPTNDAMFAFYKKMNVQSLNDFSKEYLVTLAQNHVVPFAVPSGDIGYGAIREKNLLGDKIVTEFQGQDIIINKKSKIIKRDIYLANGVAHILDQVIEPVSKDVYTIISENPSFSIFAEGLRRTGLKDTLQLISFPYGQSYARTEFTLLAVPDSIYNRYNIYSADDLITWTGASTSDDLSQLNNPFYRYMEYHCVDGTYYFSDFTTRIYSILSHDNNISMTIGNDYEINYNSKTGKYTGFIIPESDYPAKNGVMHTINDILPVTQPEPSVITFETTDYFDFKQGDYYGKYYMRWSQEDNPFEYIKFQGDYLLYYYKINTGRTPLINNDCLAIYGYWWIEITTPKIMKGNYKVSANIWTGGEDLPIFAAYVDDVYCTTINARISGASMEFCTVNWTETVPHKIRLVCRSYGSLFWDSVIFTPVK